MSLPEVKFIRDDPDAIVPTKGTPFSIGYDLTAIRFDKQVTSKTVRFDTGLKVQPPPGYYTEIIPRSSLCKTGYMLSNSVGLIDEDYRGTLLIALTKVDETMPDLQVPFVYCQLVLRKAEHYSVKEVDELSETERGYGGFGSTNKVAVLSETEHRELHIN